MINKRVKDNLSIIIGKSAQYHRMQTFMEFRFEMGTPGVSFSYN